MNPTARTGLRWASVCLTLIFSALHFVHLGADFPGRWKEHAVLTDEGWYGRAAVLEVQQQSWHMAGDFNPAVATPLFPLLETGLFYLTGVNVTAARALEAGFFLVMIFGVMWLLWKETGVDVALWVGALLSTSYFYFALSRLAILEAPAAAFLVLAACCARMGRSPVLRGLCVGVLLLASVLVKLSSAFAVPAILYFVSISASSTRSRVTAMAVSCLPLAAGLGFYRMALLRPYAADYSYFSAINMKNRLHLSGSVRSLAHALLDGGRFAPLLYILAVLSLLYLVGRRVRYSPLLKFSMLWAGCYALYMTAVHYAPPRYFVAAAVPFALWIGLATASSLQQPSGWQFLFAIGIGAAILINGTLVGLYLAKPSYSFLGMAQNIRARMIENGNPNAYLLGHFADTMSMMSGVHSVNSEHGTEPLEWRIEHYHPAYYAGEANSPDPQVLALLRKDFELTPIAHYDILNGKNRSMVVLYRLCPMPGSVSAGQ